MTTSKPALPVDISSDGRPFKRENALQFQLSVTNTTSTITARMTELDGRPIRDTVRWHLGSTPTRLGSIHTASAVFEVISISEDGELTLRLLPDADI